MCVSSLVCACKSSRELVLLWSFASSCEATLIEYHCFFELSRDDFETKPEFKKLANLFLDFFRGRTTTMINLKGLENVIVMTAVEGVVFFR